MLTALQQAGKQQAPTFSDILRTNNTVSQTRVNTLNKYTDQYKNILDESKAAAQNHTTPYKQPYMLEQGKIKHAQAKFTAECKAAEANGTVMKRMKLKVKKTIVENGQHTVVERLVQLYAPKVHNRTETTTTDRTGVGRGPTGDSGDRVLEPMSPVLPANGYNSTNPVTEITDLHTTAVNIHT